MEMFTPDKVEQLLAGNPSFVLDAIDNIDTKASLRVVIPLGCLDRDLPGLKFVLAS